MDQTMMIGSIAVAVPILLMTYFIISKRRNPNRQTHFQHYDKRIATTGTASSASNATGYGGQSDCGTDGGSCT
ncbi:hypothetical protein IC620_04790 [Hazenella sp. IB182357]|uniref:Uncharacterized protein n=1 Tax=Polycladospora coralii TaxID=2771432 RepID=A0A926N5D6_9BACL|nr:hypothetical protein [Polycladospora coralii]MBD1371674.1 hypothetical protein [Polycladospora coralii]MBS7529141.1 hypothetical protein [Polycladospora coralii]